MSFPKAVLEQLNADLDPSRIAIRDGAGSMKLSYLEGYDVIDTANRIFGYDGWSHDLISVGRDSIEPKVINAVVRVNVHVHGIAEDAPVAYVSHTDVGIGTVKGSAVESVEVAYKEAVTDGLKRAFRALGNQFGNSLYDKHSELHALAKANAGFSTAVKKAVPDRAPVAASGKTFVCENDNCSRTITDSPTMSAERKVELSKQRNGGKILCYPCEKKGS